MWHPPSRCYYFLTIQTTEQLTFTSPHIITFMVGHRTRGLRRFIGLGATAAAFAALRSLLAFFLAG